MGAPIAPNDKQYQALLEASRLARVEPPTPVRGPSGETVVQFTLPRQGVSLLLVERVH
jgi:xylan 1,4-beta-xylosidase